MKKLLILMLVLGLTSAANAILVDDIDLSLDGSTDDSGAIYVAPSSSTDIYVVSKVGGDTELYWTFLEFNLPSEGSVSYAGIAVQPNAGVNSNTNDWSTGSLYDVELNVADNVGGDGYPLAGAHWKFQLVIGASAATDGSDDFDIWITGANDGTYAATSTMNVNIIPEPMTIALLGLGGLLLRRRKGGRK